MTSHALVLDRIHSTSEFTLDNTPGFNILEAERGLALLLCQDVAPRDLLDVVSRAFQDRKTYDTALTALVLATHLEGNFDHRDFSVWGLRHEAHGRLVLNHSALVSLIVALMDDKLTTQEAVRRIIVRAREVLSAIKA